jgi:signal transduction histidine kinase
MAAGWRLKAMADTLLDVSRLEEGRMPVVRTPTNLAAMARETRDAMAKIETDRPIEVVAADDVTALCDAGLTRRVLENLVSNAIKHTPRAGKVRIRVASHDGGVLVAVEDEGPGVPAEAKPRIFEKFGAAVVRRDQTYHSVGLGLAFCRLVAEAHGGSIAVSDATPRGSVFTVMLPS